jgi:acyl-CoA thioester hydrolase
LRFEEEVEIQLLVAEVRARSIRYEFFFRKASDRTLVARGTMAAVCARVERSTGTLAAIPIPEAVRQAIQPAPSELLESTS